LFFGGSWITDLPTSSSSGFYVGNANNASGSLIGGSIFVDLAQFGDPRVLFGSWVLSAGLVVDSMRFGSINWSGRCGVAPCVGTGSLNELNVVPELKVMTALTPNFKIGAYVGFGMSWLSPHGQPTGFGGPFFVDSDTAPVWAIGLEGDYYVNPNVSIGGKVGFRHVYRTDYPTSLPGERFIFDYKNQMLA